MLFKKGYLGRKRPTTDPVAASSNGTNGYANGGMSNGSTNGDGALHNGGKDGEAWWVRVAIIATL